MENFLENIGLIDYDQDDVINLLESEANNHNVIKLEDYRDLELLQIRIDEYAGIGFLADHDDCIHELGIMCSSKAENEVTPIKWFDVETDEQYFRMLNIETNGDLDALPLNVFVPYRELVMEQEIMMNLYAFVIEAHIYESEEALSQNSKMAAESLIPSGTFGVDESFEPNCEFIMNTHILEIQKHFNRFTNCEYYVLKVNCLGLEFDVVAAIDDFEVEPKVNDIISGLFFAQGNFE